MISSLYYGFWNYWDLRHKVTFDGVNKLILINPGVTELDMQVDVYSDWKEWVALYDNLKYLPPLNTVGGEPTISGQRLDVTYFLINGWKFKPQPGTYNLNIIGNVFDVNGGDIKVPADILGNEPNNITITTNTSVIVRQLSSTGGTTSGSFDPSTIVSASLFGIQESSLFNIEGHVLAIESLLQSPITASLEPSQSEQLTNIEYLTISSSMMLLDLSLLNYSQSLQLIQLQDANYSQSLQLNSILDMLSTQSTGSAITDTKVREIWELHGLDTTKPLTVTQQKRLFGSVDQNIVTTGTGSAQQTVITRV